MSLSTSDYAALLKEYYTDDRVREMVYKNNPLLALIPKMEDYQGAHLPIPIITADTQGASHTFSEAVTSKNSLLSKSFLLTTINDYSLASVDRKVVKQSEGKKGAWLPAAKTSLDSALRTCTRRLAIGLYRSTSGSLGQLSATSGVTTTITLADINTVVNFEVGQRLVLSTADGSGSVKTGSTTIIAIDRDAGTLTVGTSMATFTAVGAVNDYIFVAGDYALACAGLAGWVPSTAPTSGDSWFGVDRSSDPVRLAGVRYTGTSLPIEEAISKGLSRLCREGANPTHVFINPVQFNQFALSLGSKVERVVAEEGKFGFSAIQVYHDGGTAKVIGDPNCQSNIAWAVQMDALKLYSTGPACDIFDKDNDQKMLRETTSDSYEMRCGGYYNVGLNAPGYVARISLNAATY